MSLNNKKIKSNHRFLDEAGDTSFYGKGKKAILGNQGVSSCFIIGMVKFKEPLEDVRDKVVVLQEKIANDPYFQAPSVLKKKNATGFYFHATDDLPETRKLFFDLIKSLNCSFEAVVGRKSLERYETKHKGREEYFYADLLSHLLKNKIEKEHKLVLNVSERGSSTKHHNLTLALEKAKERLAETRTRKNTGEKVSRHDINANTVFNVQNPTQEPLLCVADYFCWTIQRVFEKGETRFYDFLLPQISLVVDLYDTNNFYEWRNYYSPKNPLTGSKKISPQKH